MYVNIYELDQNTDFLLLTGGRLVPPYDDWNFPVLRKSLERLESACASLLLFLLWLLERPASLSLSSSSSSEKPNLSLRFLRSYRFFELLSVAFLMSASSCFL
jgi:hypothetical protein